MGGGWAVRQAELLRGSPWPSAYLSLHSGEHTNRSHRRVLCAVARHPERRTCSTRSALHYFILVFADRRPASYPTDARLPHDHHPAQGEEPRMRGRPGCIRACHPADSVANCAASASPPSTSGKPGGNSIPQLRVPCSLRRPRTLDVLTLARPCEISGPLALRVRIRGSRDGRVPM